MKKERRHSVHYDPGIRQFVENIVDYSQKKYKNIDALQFSVSEIKNQSIGEYKPDTIYGIVIAIEHHLGQNGKFMSIWDNKEHCGLRLDAKRATLSTHGHGMSKHKYKNKLAW